MLFAVLVFTSFLKHGNKATTTTIASTTTTLVPATADVKMTGCTYANYAATARLTVTNHTDQEFQYAVHVLFLDGKKLSGLAVATTDRLRPAQRVNLLATNLGVGKAPTHLRCVITVIKRFLP